MFNSRPRLNTSGAQTRARDPPTASTPMITSRIKSNGPDGAADHETVADMISLTLSMLGTDNQDATETSKSATKPVRSQSRPRTAAGRREHWAVRSRGSQQPPPMPRSQQQKTASESKSGKRSSTPGRAMREEDWERTVHRLQSSQTIRDAKVKALGKEIQGAQDQQLSQKERWYVKPDGGLPPHRTLTDQMTAGMTPLPQRAQQVLTQRDQNRSSLSKELRSSKPVKRPASVGRRRTVADRMEWQRERDDRVAQLRSESIEADLLAVSQRTPRGSTKAAGSGTNAHERLHGMHKSLLEKKEQARVAHLEAELLEIKSSSSNGRVLYPDELGVFNRGQAHKTRKKGQLEEYHKAHNKPDKG